MIYIKQKNLLPKNWAKFYSYGMTTMIFPSPARAEVPGKYQDKPTPLHKKIFNVIDDHTTDVEMIGDAAKIIRDAYEVAGAAKGREINPNVTSHMNALADTFEILEIPGNIKTLVHIATKKALTPYKKKMHGLKATSAIFSIAFGIMSGFKLVNELILEKLEHLSLMYGKTPVFGLPFTTVFGSIDLIKTGVEAAISVFKLRKYSKDISHTAQKIKSWKKPIDASFAKAKVTSLKGKQAILLKNMQKLGAGKHCKQKATLQTRYTARQTQLAKWEKIHEKLTAGTLESGTLEKFREGKLEKWKIERINLKWRIGKEILSFVLSSITILFLFVSIVLAFTGIAALPAFILASSIISFSLSIGYLGKHLLIKYKEDLDYEKVELGCY